MLNDEKPIYGEVLYNISCSPDAIGDLNTIKSVYKRYKSALNVMNDLTDRYYAQQKKVDKIQRKIRKSWNKVNKERRRYGNTQRLEDLEAHCRKLEKKYEDEVYVLRGMGVRADCGRFRFYDVFDEYKPLMLAFKEKYGIDWQKIVYIG